MIWLLTDFTEENGDTRLLPGSHLLPESPVSSVPCNVPTIAATARPAASSSPSMEGQNLGRTADRIVDLLRRFAIQAETTSSRPSRLLKSSAAFANEG
ncbi:hypothetical protein [Bradyrhizobium sp. JR4.1]|uniref:hypothetical protein n=1 Tax=Bradyrhizobium sp. JR4.1 TaxID=3156372 RepID=UPI0033965896